MKSVAVAGAGGYVGSQIAHAVAAHGEYRLIPVHRADSAETLFSEADLIVHAANPARRFRAEKDPESDFAETVEKTAAFLALARGKPFLLVSSLSCRTQLHLSYGRNRRACELLALGAGAGVVRLGPMFGGGRVQDVLHDILAGRPVYVSADTQYAYVDVAWAGRRIVELLHEPPRLVELGARNAVRLGDLAHRYSSASTFEGGDDTQVLLECGDAPDAAGVFAFADLENARASEWL